METWKKAVVAVIAATAAVGAVAIAGYQAGWLGVPYVTAIENSWGNVSANQTQLVTSVTVKNPNPFPVTISSLHYTVLLNNVTIAEGQDDDVTLKGGATAVDYVSSVNMSSIPLWWSSHVTAGESTRIELVYTVHAGIGPIHQSRTIHETYGTVDTDLLSTLRLTQPRDITVPVQGEERRLLVAMGFDAGWSTITRQATSINATVELYNPHGSAVTIDTFVYHFTMNNLTVGSGSLDGEVTLPPSETSSVTVDTVIDNIALIDWFTSHVAKNETTSYEIDSSATFTFNGRQHTVQPVHRTGTFSTDLLS